MFNIISVPSVEGIKIIIDIPVKSYIIMVRLNKKKLGKKKKSYTIKIVGVFA